MKFSDRSIQLSATDLAEFLDCEHLTQLDRLAGLGKLKPPVWRDPMLDLLQERGLKHERAYLEYLCTEQELDVLELEDAGIAEESSERTRVAVLEGVAAIAHEGMILRDGVVIPRRLLCRNLDSRTETEVELEGVVFGPDLGARFFSPGALERRARVLLKMGEDLAERSGPLR